MTATERWNKAKKQFEAAKLVMAEATKELRQARRALIDELNAGEMNLTRRETEVLELVRQRQANKEIATALNICERTVKFHVSSLLAKFNAADRTEL